MHALEPIPCRIKTLGQYIHGRFGDISSHVQDQYRSCLLTTQEFDAGVQHGWDQRRRRPPCASAWPMR